MGKASPENVFDLGDRTQNANGKKFAIGKFGRELVFNEKYNTVLIYGFKIFLNSTFTAHIHRRSEKNLLKDTMTIGFPCRM